jgi:polyferredoxin
MMAFCKYLCPITAILKTTSRFALIKIGGSPEKCHDCGTCVKACPMNITIPEYLNKGPRVLSTECILCLTCTTVCPEGVLGSTLEMDIGGKELLVRNRGCMKNKGR